MLSSQSPIQIHCHLLPLGSDHSQHRPVLLPPPTLIPEQLPTQCRSPELHSTRRQVCPLEAPGPPRSHPKQTHGPVLCSLSPVPVLGDLRFPVATTSASLHVEPLRYLALPPCLQALSKGQARNFLGIDSVSCSEPSLDSRMELTACQICDV